MKYAYILLMGLVFVTFSDTQVFARPIKQDAQGQDDHKAVDKNSSVTVSSSKHKSDIPGNSPKNSETVVFPKVSKIENPSDDWPTKSPEHSGRTRGNR